MPPSSISARAWVFPASCAETTPFEKTKKLPKEAGGLLKCVCILLFVRFAYFVCGNLRPLQLMYVLCSRQHHIQISVNTSIHCRGHSKPFNMTTECSLMTKNSNQPLPHRWSWFSKKPPKTKTIKLILWTCDFFVVEEVGMTWDVNTKMIDFCFWSLSYVFLFVCFVLGFFFVCFFITSDEMTSLTRSRSLSSLCFCSPEAKLPSH